ncbi:hypothetical protein C942_02346 [Photobacterium marinum]|uniref:Uncharacterized protein n=1 Tax=Photobacterium marinum TaxID=1056511 RepID=L8J8K5_9GAMM|nr:hypothetical protein [Photobacterium marinum]ELR64533.1 hypothetical protein C942_02346 [Photobacterium marinum]
MSKKNQGIEKDKKLTPAEKTLEKLRIWIREQTRESIVELDNKGKINRQKFKAQSGVNSRAVTGQNPKATTMLRRIELKWRKAGWLSEVAKSASSGSGQSNSSGYDEPEFLDPRDAEIARLNGEISKLKQQLYQKDIQLKRFDEFKDVLYREGFFS